MITIINATGRKGNKTQVISSFIQGKLGKLGAESEVLTLEKLPVNFWFENVPMDGENVELEDIIKVYIQPVKSFIIIAPEYNGSFPGVLKSFIDSVPPKHFKEKRVMLVGVSSGRAGNLRGMEHLTGVLHHLNMFVMPQKLPISAIHQHIDENLKLTDSGTIEALESHLQKFLKFIG